LEWWKLHSLEYPTLARIAKDFHAIPATSVSSERIFSKAERLLSSTRTRLKGDVVRKIMTLSSWWEESWNQRSFDTWKAQGFEPLKTENQ
jgi:hypothetical protein